MRIKIIHVGMRKYTPTWTSAYNDYPWQVYKVPLYPRYKSTGKWALHYDKTFWGALKKYIVYTFK